MFDHCNSLNVIPWLYTGYFSNLLVEIKRQVKSSIGGFKNCTYIYVNLTYYESLKTSVNYSSVELFNSRDGNYKDFLLFIMSIIYIGSGTSNRKLSHCDLSKALKHGMNKNPQIVHRKILEAWLFGADIGILDFCNHSSVQETKLFEGFLILFLTHFDYDVANERQGSLPYDWRVKQKLVSLNIGFMMIFKIYQKFINDICNPIKISDVLYKPRKASKRAKFSKFLKNH